MQAVNNVSECYVKIKQTNNSCSHSKISQSIDMHLKRFNWKTDSRTMKDIRIYSKVQINENQRKSDVPENSKIVYDYEFLQNKLCEGNLVLIKVN